MAINKATILGHVGAEPKITVLSSGTKCATFSIATTERGYLSKNGQQIPDKTTWHNIVVWKGIADVVEKYVKKGSQIYIEGKIENSKYTDKNGIERYKTEIVANTLELLGGNKSSQPERTEPVETREPQKVEVNGEEFILEPPDDLPF